jgi:ankyrin repeat protein
MITPSKSFVTVLLMSLRLKTHCNSAILYTSKLLLLHRISAHITLTLWRLLYKALTRYSLDDGIRSYHVFSWSLDGYKLVARIAKSILSTWCIDKNWIDDHAVFITAAEYGHTAVLELLLADPRVDKAAIDHANECGTTALMRAAGKGHTSTVELLLADPRLDKASIDHANKGGETTLIRASRRDFKSIVELLLADPRVDKASIDHADGIGSTAFLWAASNCRASIVELLLADPRVDKASIDCTTEYGHTAMWCAADSGYASIVELLLADPRVDKASINHTNECGENALMRAAKNGHALVVGLLLTGARVDQDCINQVDQNGRTALWYAAAHDSHASVSFLISDSRTSWESIIELVDDWRIMSRAEILSLLKAELTCRQMCVIYPSTSRQLWPVPVQSGGSGDVAPGDPTQDDEPHREDGIAEPVSECALITSFFKSDLFDVNVLGIIREYATYTM